MYRKKARTFLSDRNACAVPKSNPTEKTEREFNKRLSIDVWRNPIRLGRSWKNYCVLEIGYLRDSTACSDVPLRPIVSSVNSPTCIFLRHFPWILSSMIGNTLYTVKNFPNISRIYKRQNSQRRSRLESSDAVSLFTKISLVSLSKSPKKD